MLVITQEIFNGCIYNSVGQLIPMVSVFAVKFGRQFFAYLEKFVNLFVDFLSLDRGLERHPGAVKVEVFRPHPGVEEGVSLDLCYERVDQLQFLTCLAGRGFVDLRSPAYFGDLGVAIAFAVDRAGDADLVPGDPLRFFCRRASARTSPSPWSGRTSARRRCISSSAVPSSSSRRI